MNVKQLDGAILNFWVAKSGGLNLLREASQPDGDQIQEGTEPDSRGFNPSANWSHGGPIVANEWYGIEGILKDWFGFEWNVVAAVERYPLKWFMRAYVASMFGDEVEDISDVSLRGPS